MSKLTKQQRKARRRRIVSRAVALAKEIHGQDEDAQKAMLAEILNKAIDIPGLGENAERRILMAVMELIIDLVSEDDNG